MSTATTNQTVPTTDPPVLSVPLLESIPPAVHAELTPLRGELAATKLRLDWLESRVSVSPLVRPLMPPDSPECQFAMDLAAEVFPGCESELEVECDPAEPEWPWYSLAIRWQGARAEVMDKRLLWHRRMSDAFPHLRDEFRLSIC